MRFARIICRVAEVALDLVKVLSGNWAAVISLLLNTVELYQVLREQTQPAPAAI